MISFWLLNILFYDKRLELTHISAIETRPRTSYVFCQKKIKQPMDHVVSPSLIVCLFCLLTWTHYHQYIQGHLFEESCGFLNHSFSLDNDLLSRKCGYIFFYFFYVFIVFIVLIFSFLTVVYQMAFTVVFRIVINLGTFVFWFIKIPATLVESVVLLLVRSDDKSWRRYSVTIVTWWRP